MNLELCDSPALDDDPTRNKPARRTPRSATETLARDARGMIINQDLDSVDIKILTLLQRDGSISTTELAERVGISQSPCWRRLQRLRDEGYIKATVALVDRYKLGFTMQIFAQLKLSRLTEVQRAELLHSIQAIPEILECHTVLGKMDILMKILAPDIVWYQEFLVSVIMKLPGVEDIHSIVTLSETKHTTAVPLHAKPSR